MGRAAKGGTFAVAAVAETITDALSLTGNKHFSKITVLNDAGAANDAYTGGSDVTNVPANNATTIPAGKSYTYGGDGRGYFSTDTIYVVGTVNAANVITVTLEE